ncbi:MAG: DNA methyltransferase [Thermoplasmata archaeon]
MSNKLPFLHTQILELAYNELMNNSTSLDFIKITEETGYPLNSKILSNAIQKLNEKGFIQTQEIQNNGTKLLKLKLPSKKPDIFNILSCKDTSKKTGFIPTINFEEYFKEYQSRRNYQYQIDKTKMESLNNYGIVHKWYDYLEDFPFQFTWDEIKKHCKTRDDIVLDPFSGSGTTLVTAKLTGHNAYGVDVSPLMKFISEVKTTWGVDLELFKNNMSIINKKLLSGFKDIDEVKIKNDFLQNMPKKEINQWLSPILQKQIAFTKDKINEIESEKIRKIFLFAMAKSAFDGSYVALCPGTTFYPYRKKIPFYELFIKKLNQIYYDLNILSKMDHYGQVKVINGDSRKVSKLISKKVKLSLTSPPYPNDLEYTRQTRLELYLLDFVKNMDEVRTLKKSMVKGSTKLIFKESDSAKFVENNSSVNKVANKIAVALKDKNWGFDYPRMIREYFGDMFLNLKSHLEILDEGGVYILVVGDQTYKNIVIPVGKILAEMGKEMGYSKAEIEHHRMRRSTTHNIPLPEENVILYR